jgi:hypothetical protein
MLLFQLDAIWTSMPAQEYPLDKQAVRTWLAEINEVTDDTLLGERQHDMSVSFQVFPVNVLGATRLDPELRPRVHSSHEMRSRGRQSLGCTQAVAINATLRYPNNTWYGTTMYISTLAHEITHTYQGMICTANDEWVESTAEIGALAMLGELAEDDEDAERALVYILRHRLIQAALDLGEDREFLDKLHLTEKEREYYDGLSKDYLARYNWYWTLPITLILNDDDGMLDDMATVSGQIDASALFEFLQKVQE